MATANFVFATTYPYFCSKHTPVHNSICTEPMLKHKRKHKKYSLMSNTYNALLEIRVCHHNGDIRLEYLCVPLPFSPSSRDSTVNVLYEESDFRGNLDFLYGVPVEVKAWNQEICRLDFVLSGDFAEKEKGKEGMVIHEIWNNEHFLLENKDAIRCFLYMSDQLVYSPLHENHKSQTKKTDVCNISKICLMQHEPKMHERLAPHYPSPVSIQNLCGFCVLPYEITFKSFYPVSKKNKRQLCEAEEDEEEAKLSIGKCESLCTISGTFKLCASRVRIDFRGVRSLSLMEDDWEMISAVALENVDVFVYMIVLRGNIGKALFFGQETLFTEKEQGCYLHDYKGVGCFLGNGICRWCTCVVHADDVCEVLNVSKVNWEMFSTLYPEVHISDITKSAETLSMNISRKGGTIIRVTFSCGTRWNILCENQVVCDCNRLLNIFHTVALGK